MPRDERHPAAGREPGGRIEHLCRRFWPVAFWLAVWHIASIAVSSELLLVSPLAAIARLGELMGEADFWASIALSFARIASGFLAALLAGTACAALAARIALVRDLLAPLVAAIKAVPVASFVILVLIWVSSDYLSTVVSFLMVFPLVYANVLEGIRQTDRGLLEMASVFGMGTLDRVRFIYCSQVLPYFQTACSLALGLCWKAGVAAEVIGLPAHSIGEHLYEAKVYLSTPDLFAWTFAIVCISVAIERAFAKLVEYGVRRLERAL